MTVPLDNTSPEVSAKGETRNKFIEFVKSHFDFKHPTFSSVGLWLSIALAFVLLVLGVLLGVGVNWAWEWVGEFNSIAWVASNILVAYVGVVLVVFILGYYLLFDPRATTAGQFIFRFAVSLGGVIGLIFISLFVDPQIGREWYNFPGDVLIWRPIARLVAYFYVAYTITGLAVLLVVRKWYPQKLRTSLDYGLVKTRKSK